MLRNQDGPEEMKGREGGSERAEAVRYRRREGYEARAREEGSASAIVMVCMYAYSMCVGMLCVGVGVGECGIASDKGEWARPLETQVFGAFGNNLRLELCSSFCAGHVLIFSGNKNRNPSSCKCSRNPPMLHRFFINLIVSRG